ncbi:hypothetical protein [Arvimicrobium flavum]|uniref:hypothetical protein n=1 Tax=Arvimicrobium flavum TaxID=3393320 RepID=UPI00237BCDCF|nr:hypothetical protein [Mesorhizobium shangrilense]
MIRFLFRFLAAIALAIAVIMAVLDATRTVAASELVMTPLVDSWTAMSPDSLEAAQAFVSSRLHPLVWDPVATSLLALPGFAVFALLSLGLFAIGHRPVRRSGDFALEG